MLMAPVYSCMAGKSRVEAAEPDPATVSELVPVVNPKKATLPAFDSEMLELVLVRAAKVAEA